jgi:hypothetical protein
VVEISSCFVFICFGFGQLGGDRQTWSNRPPPIHGQTAPVGQKDFVKFSLLFVCGSFGWRCGLFLGSAMVLENLRI